MAMNYAYQYAIIDPATNMCIGFQDRTLEIPEDELPENWVLLPVNDPEYIAKYYIDGAWYEDAAGTIPWTSALL